MPYLKQNLRDVLNLNPNSAQTPGELNYAITTALLHALGKDPQCPHEWNEEIVLPLLMNYVKGYIERKGQESYSTYNDVIGVLMCVGLEAGRRLPHRGEQLKIQQVVGKAIVMLYTYDVGPYEDEKRKENGDVY